MSTDLEALAVRLRVVLEESDLATARQSFAKRAPALSVEDRTRLARLVFGADRIEVVHDLILGDKVLGGTAEPRDHARIYGPNVGLNLGTIIYGRVPGEEERERLVAYLHRLSSKLHRLPIRGLAPQLDEGTGIALSGVYVTLATERHVLVAWGHKHNLTQFFDRETPTKLHANYDPATVLPDTAIVRVEPLTDPVPTDDDLLAQLLGVEPVTAPPCAAHSGGSEGSLLGVWRTCLVSEVTFTTRRLVLLGQPGGGKSTCLRHLAWALARRGLDQLDATTTLFGWSDTTRLLPVLLPLRRLAGRIIIDGANPGTVSATLRDELTRSYDVRQADRLLDQALRTGAVLLLLDGLDEVPLAASAGQVADRRMTLEVVREFAELYDQTRIVVTCRSRAFAPALRSCLGWPVETLVPFTLGQMHAFVDRWFATLQERNATALDVYTQRADTLHQALRDAGGLGDKLRTLAETPLLLTMMVLVLEAEKELPRDRAVLYEAMLKQLLGAWDREKEGGQSLTEVIGGEVRSEHLRATLDRLCYTAHWAARSEDGRGRVRRDDLLMVLTKFFKQVNVRGSFEAAERCLAYFEERSGLLVAEDEGDHFAFAHLTLQEYGAGRHLLLWNAPEQTRREKRDIALRVLGHRNDDRWIEPIKLGLGAIHNFVTPMADRLARVLAALIDPDSDGVAKPVTRWYRDLLLAVEIGEDRSWNLLGALVDTSRLQRDLRQGLVALLRDRSQPLPARERIQAGFVLGELGDPRFPMTIDQWRAEVERALCGDTTGYFCRIEAGSYVIGSTDDDPDADDDEKPQHIMTLSERLLIGRYPITNAQWQTWVQQGGQQSYANDVTNRNQPNQPVVAVTLRMSHEFCCWLSTQVGVEVRLPTEHEWEAAARGGDARRFPWGNEWRDDHAASEEDQETRGWRDAVPVGCYPIGAAPCGALDMAGNVWEWCQDTSHFCACAENSGTDDEVGMLRGGGYLNDRTYVRCGARVGDRPNDHFGIDGGFRCVLALKFVCPC